MFPFQNINIVRSLINNKIGGQHIIPRT